MKVAVFIAMLVFALTSLLQAMTKGQAYNITLLFGLLSVAFAVMAVLVAFGGLG